MSNAIFGLVGVALGGAISFGVQYFMARRGETAAKRTTARLLSMDFGRVAASIDRRLTDPRVGRDPWDAELATDDWPARLERLAQPLAKDEWEAVAAPLQEVEHVRATVAALEWTPSVAADDGVRARLEQAKRSIEVARRTLEPHLG